MSTKEKENQRSQWNSIALSLSYRAEELSNATTCFADTVFLNILRSNQNQVILVRRGTGKTHLLKRLYEEYNGSFEANLTVPILLNGSSLQTESIASVRIPSVVGLSLYIEVIKKITRELYDFINSSLDVKLWDRIFGGKNTKTAKKAQGIAQQLYELIHKGQIRYLPAGEASEEIKSLYETIEKISGGVKLNLSDPKNIGWKLEIGAEGSDEIKKSGIELKKIKGEIILPFSQVTKKIQELLDLLEGAKIVLLFDEWSDTDKQIDTQPYLADMLRRTLSSITRMHVKLACIPIRTRLATPVTFENPIPIGYELGDDINIDVDLE
ncbi:MAG: hypothetical protein SRB1_01182 [Desulfobacteraceae bacterium Eth-SRB1]|nr:MAG: hypothetical protein SRB1_01182 [Desulfobacteraceae bacterium Eth-SRB1]